jgi:hypothetical protein
MLKFSIKEKEEMKFGFLRAFVSVFQGQPQNPPHPSRGTTPRVPTQLQHTAAMSTRSSSFCFRSFFHIPHTTHRKKKMGESSFNIFKLFLKNKKNLQTFGAWRPHGKLMEISLSYLCQFVFLSFFVSTIFIIFDDFWKG